MEKRIYERISLPVKLTYEVKNRPRIVEESVSKNISGSGICLPLREKLPVNTELIIRIEVGKDGDGVTLNGRIVWNRRVDINGGVGPLVFYDTGIELINPDPININRVITCYYGKPF
ncbi:MAG: PilZ domain-containing protein [Candidatus Omnitrophota bacterium]